MKNTIIVIIVILVLGFFGYNFLVKSPKQEDGLVSSANNNSINVGAGLLAALGTIDTLKIDTEFFKDPTFRRLVNFSKEIPTQPKGRSNPFAPIGASDAGAVSTSTTNSR